MCPWCRDPKSVAISRGGPNDGFLCTSCNASWLWDDYVKGITRVIYPGKPGYWRPASSVTTIRDHIRDKVMAIKAEEIYKTIMEAE